MKVLVTDGNTRPALAVTRALGQLGHDVIVAAERYPSLASVSRYCTVQETYPSLQREPGNFAAAVAEIASRYKVDVALPITEITTLLLAEGRLLLPSTCTTPLPAATSIRVANDKAQVFRLAEELGVPTPKTIIAESASNLPNVDKLAFPIVVKPACSRVRIADRWMSTSVSYARDYTDLVHRLRSLPTSAFPVLLQERIVGPGVGVFACFQHGQPIALFSHRRIREKPPSGGVSVLSESVIVDPAAAAHAVRLLARLEWRGVAMVEFKTDHRDGSMRLMEINGRFWGSLQLAIDSGINFPALQLAVATGLHVPRTAEYRAGVRSRWLGGDFDVLMMTMLRSRGDLDLPECEVSRLSVLGNFLKFFGKDLHYEIERPDDWRPAYLEWRDRLLGQ
jgi:predicted ATP-grasp superfamily ATP-dependent carboligase